MATIIETDIGDFQACVIRRQGQPMPQLLVSFETIDASGTVVRRLESPDWFPDAAPASQAAIQQLVVAFMARAKAQAEIP